MKITKVALCIIVGLVSVAASNIMAVDIDDAQLTRAVHIAIGESKHKKCLEFLLSLSKYPDQFYDLPARLIPCSNSKVNQFWILSPEGYIRSLGNLCLSYEPNLASPRNIVSVKDCNKSSEEAKKWKILSDGTIAHIATPNHVLTAAFAVPHSFVGVELNTYAASQGWKILYNNVED